VILGLFASIVAPYFQRGRESAWEDALTSDIRSAIVTVEGMVAADGRWPRSIEEVEAAGWTPSKDTEVCLFLPVPATRFRGEYFIMVSAHPAGETVVWTAYPVLDGRVNSYVRDGQRGCDGFQPRT